MFKSYIYLAAISFASITFVAATQIAHADSGMNIRKFTPPPELEKRKTPETAKEVPEPAVAKEDEQNITESEDEVWKKYKTLLSKDSKPKKKQKTVALGKDKDKKQSAEKGEEEEKELSEEEKEEQEAQNAVFNINNILSKYKKDNKAKVNSRSFASPETIESMGDGKDSDPDDFEEVPEEEVESLNLNE